MSQLVVIVLAAGQGKRMKSATPKMLHTICGKPVLSYVLSAVTRLKPDRLLVVVGHGSQEVVAAIDHDVELVIQEAQLGTGHAVQTAMRQLSGYTGDVLVVCGDTPLLETSTLSLLVESHRAGGARATVTTSIVKAPEGYGRIVRGAEQGIECIVEERDATPEQKLIAEINTGVYCFESRALGEVLSLLDDHNDQKELYLTDAIQIIRSRDGKVSSFAANQDETQGVNSRSELARVEQAVLSRLRRTLMDEGVGFVMPETTYVEAGVKISPDTIIGPNCHLAGSTTIGSDCHVGPGAVLYDCRLGERVRVSMTVGREVEIADDVEVGPFCSLRPGTLLGPGSKAGTFVELKKTEVGEGSKVPHLSYMGDATIGKDVNIGAGTITCNYDGIKKSPTVVEDGAFVGSDTMLIAPVRVGKGAVTGAGSAITEDVPAGSLGLERADQKNIAGWAERHFSKKDKKSERK